MNMTDGDGLQNPWPERDKEDTKRRQVNNANRIDQHTRDMTDVFMLATLTPAGWAVSEACAPAGEAQQIPGDRGDKQPQRWAKQVTDSASLGSKASLAFSQSALVSSVDC